MILNILGSGGVGKTTLAELLGSAYPNQFVRLITYTSRKPRLGEVDGKSYHFIDSRLEVGDGYVLRRVREDVVYGVRRIDLESTSKIVVTTFPPRGVLKLEQLGYAVCSFYLELPEPESISRMRKRGDDSSTIKNRVQADNIESSLPIVQQMLSFQEVIILDARKSVEVLASEIKQKIDRMSSWRAGG